MSDDLPTIKAHPDFDSFSSDELKIHIRSLEEQVNFGQVHGAEHLVIVSLIQERRSAQAELARRNGLGPPNQQPEFWPEFLNAKDFLSKPEDPQRWIWEDCLAAGVASILVAKPKVGKSFLATNLAIAIARGYPFLARGVTQGPVAYLSLDATHDEMRDVFKIFGLKDSDPIFTHTGRAPVKAQKWVMEQVGKNGVKLLIVDTLQKVFRFQNINDYSEINNATEPLLSAAKEQGCHVMFLHHAGKESRDDLDSAIGSTGLRGLAYTYLHLKRLSESTQRILRTDQRGGRNFDEIAISDGKDGWIEKIGTRMDAEIEIFKPQIIEFLEEQPGAQEKEIHMAIPGQGRIMSRALRALMKLREVERTGTGKRGNAFHYYLAGQLIQEPEKEEEKERSLFQAK